MQMNWDDLKLFLDVARLGGLSAAARATGASPATLGRRITALEAAIGEPLFVRERSGYRLTPTGSDLLARAADIEGGFKALERWREERHAERVVRISAGHWTSSFLAAHFNRLWTPQDRLRVELVTGNAKVDIGHRHADLGIRNARPTEQWLAGRAIGHVAFAIYGPQKLTGGAASGMFVGFSSDASTPSARWLETHHPDRIGVRGNDSASVRELIAAGAGLSVLPCFVGDRDQRLARATGLITDLQTEQWLVSHHDDRHGQPVRLLSNRLVALMKENKDLFAGRQPQ